MRLIDWLRVGLLLAVILLPSLTAHRLHQTVDRLSQALSERDAELRLNHLQMVDAVEYIQLLESQAMARWENFLGDAGSWAVKEFHITGYAPFDDPVGLCSDGNPHSTATGTYPTEGRTIAVDPRVIPYGTPVWIEGLGWRVAEDTGGAIKGDRIDVMFLRRSDALQVNRKVIVVYPKGGS